MELRQLDYLVAVVEEANFTRAAARLHVAQPGVSAQIRRLERDLGQALVDRSGRTVRVTEAGAAVLPFARAALAAVADARLAVDGLTGLLRGHLTIGTVTSISAEDVDLPGLLSEFHDACPAVEISLETATSDQLVEALRAGRFDAVFVGLGASTPAGVETHVITSEPLVAVVGHDDPMAARTTIRLTALAERALISLPRGTGLRSCLDAACLTAGFTPHVAFEAGDPRVLAQFAATGLGVAIVPRSVAQACGEELHPITITNPELRGRIALAWRTNGPISPAANAFIHRTRGTLAEAPADRPRQPRRAAGR